MKKILIALFTVSLVVACGDDGGNGGGAPGYTHNQLAQLFIDELNLNSDVQFDLVKSSTKQFNYVVIYDIENDSYDAVNIGTFRAGDDPLQHLETYRNYFDLDVIPGYYESGVSYSSLCDCYEESSTWIPTSYRDRHANITFEKTMPTPKDRLTMAVLEEGVMVRKAASALSAKFGMSQERSFEVAELAVIWKNAPKDRMSDAEHDLFAENVLGHSITEYKAAVEKQMSGDTEELNELISDTAELNGLSPEKANQIINSVFGVQLN